MMTTKTTKTWTCDACGAREQSESLPRPRAYRSWARIKWEQDDGFDYHGCPWANRVPGEGYLDLCDVCADAVYAVITARKTSNRSADGRKAAS